MNNQYKLGKINFINDYDGEFHISLECDVFDNKIIELAKDMDKENFTNKFSLYARYSDCEIVSASIDYEGDDESEIDLMVFVDEVEFLKMVDKYIRSLNIEIFKRKHRM